MQAEAPHQHSCENLRPHVFVISLTHIFSFQWEDVLGHEPRKPWAGSCYCTTGNGADHLASHHRPCQTCHSNYTGNTMVVRTWCAGCAQALGIFWGGVNRYAATTLIVALSPGHSATGNHLDRAEKIPNLLRRLAPLTFLIRVQAFWDPLRGELPYVQIFMNDGPNPHEMPSCSAIDLAEIRRSFKISSWIWSIISGVVTALGRPGRGASQVEKSPRLNWDIQFLTVAYDGTCSPNVSVRIAWLSFGTLPCRKKKTWWQLSSQSCWNSARRLTCFLSAL